MSGNSGVGHKKAPSMENNGCQLMITMMMMQVSDDCWSAHTRTHRQQNNQRVWLRIWFINIIKKEYVNMNDLAKLNLQNFLLHDHFGFYFNYLS